MLAGESQQAGVGVDDIVPLDGLAPEGAGASVYALRDPGEVIAQTAPVRIQCQMIDPRCGTGVIPLRMALLSNITLGGIRF